MRVKPQKFPHTLYAPFKWLLKKMTKEMELKDSFFDGQCVFALFQTEFGKGRYAPRANV